MYVDDNARKSTYDTLTIEMDAEIRQRQSEVLWQSPESNSINNIAEQ